MNRKQERYLVGELVADREGRSVLFEDLPAESFGDIHKVELASQGDVVLRRCFEKKRGGLYRKSAKACS